MIAFNNKTYMNLVYYILLFIYVTYFIADCEITMLDANISSHDLIITVNFVADDPRALYSCKLNNRDFVDCK